MWSPSCSKLAFVGHEGKFRTGWGLWASAFELSSKRGLVHLALARALEFCLLLSSALGDFVHFPEPAILTLTGNIVLLVPRACPNHTTTKLNVFMILVEGRKE